MAIGSMNTAAVSTDNASTRPQATVLAVASGGGHWKQLLKITGGMDDFNWVYITTEIENDSNSRIPRTCVVDANARTPLKFGRLLVQTFRHLRKHRPDFIVSTGAFPGLSFILVGRLLGIQSIWIDSIANAEKLSWCGSIALRVATITATQWEHLTRHYKGLHYAGAIL